MDPLAGRLRRKTQGLNEFTLSSLRGSSSKSGLKCIAGQGEEACITAADAVSDLWLNKGFQFTELPALP